MRLCAPVRSGLLQEARAILARPLVKSERPGLPAGAFAFCGVRLGTLFEARFGDFLATLAFVSLADPFRVPAAPFFPSGLRPVLAIVFR